MMRIGKYNKFGLIVGMVSLAVILSFLTIFNGSDFALAQASRTKLCSVVVPDNWRDTISVPSGWNSGTCQSYARSVGATFYQLGCGFSNSFSLGAENGGTPNPNCGWQHRRRVRSLIWILLLHRSILGNAPCPQIEAVSLSAMPKALRHCPMQLKA